MPEFIIVILIAAGFVLVLTRSNRHEPGPGRPPAKTRPVPHRSGGRSMCPATPPQGKLRGKCYVIDGDTIIVKGVKIRLAGIDAPELDEPFGQKAKWAMVGICRGQAITVNLNGETSYDRLVGTCYLPDGRDIGAELIKQGLAVDWGTFSGGKYRGFEPAGIRQRLRRYPYNGRYARVTPNG